MKLKAWDPETRCFKECGVLSDGVAFEEILSNSTNKVIEMRPDWVVLQSTERNDINRVEIFEGDIVRWKDKHGNLVDNFPEESYFEEVVKISFVERCGCTIDIKASNFGYEGENLWPWDEIEVIGNVFENSELLKDEYIVEDL